MDNPSQHSHRRSDDILKELKPCWHEVKNILAEGSYSSELRIELLMDRIEARS